MSLGIGNDLERLVSHRQWEYDTAVSRQRQRVRWRKLQAAKRRLETQQVLKSTTVCKITSETNEEAERLARHQALMQEQAERGRVRDAKKLPEALQRLRNVNEQLADLAQLPIEGRYFEHLGAHVYRQVEETPNRFVLRCALCYQAENPRHRMTPESGPRPYITE